MYLTFSIILLNPINTRLGGLPSLVLWALHAHPHNWGGELNPGPYYCHEEKFPAIFFLQCFLLKKKRATAERTCKKKNHIGAGKQKIHHPCGETKSYGTKAQWRCVCGKGTPFFFPPSGSVYSNLMAGDVPTFE